MTAARAYLLAAAGLAWLLAAAPVSAQKAVYLVRHAEKVDESEDPLLSAAGSARAEALARTLRSAGVKAIYATQYKRTALTAAPLAKALGLAPAQLHSDASQALVDLIRKDHPDDAVLVVGHTNSVPRAIKLLGVEEPVELAHDEYDALFVVVPRAAGPPTLLRLRY